MIPYLLMTALFLALAALTALESSFTSLQILPWFNGLVWLRVHLITLGALTQILFGALPIITAMRHQLPRPKIRWDIWALLNGGILTLLVGIPLISRVPIIIGGSLVFAATLLLMVQLGKMRAASSGVENGRLSPSHGRPFYIAGLIFFLIGILIGTGLWIGWMNPLGIVGNPKEVHIHANSWGLMSLVFAGLLFDLYPTWSQKPLAYPKSVVPIFWMMSAGAFGLVFGPWLGSQTLLVPGLLLHLTATIWLLVNLIKPMSADRAAVTPGIAHLIGSYFWILAPILSAPFVLFELGSVPGDIIEAMAPQALVYGWMLQFGIAIIPYFFAKTLIPTRSATLGGTWFSFGLINLGSIFLWISIFAGPAQATLHGIAYLLWLVALTPIVWQLFDTLRDGLAQFEQTAVYTSAESATD